MNVHGLKLHDQEQEYHSLPSDVAVMFRDVLNLPGFFSPALPSASTGAHLHL